MCGLQTRASSITLDVCKVEQLRVAIETLLFRRFPCDNRSPAPQHALYWTLPADIARNNPFARPRDASNYERNLVYAPRFFQRRAVAFQIGMLNRLVSRRDLPLLS